MEEREGIGIPDRSGRRDHLNDRRRMRPSRCGYICQRDGVIWTAAAWPGGTEDARSGPKRGTSRFCGTVRKNRIRTPKSSAFHLEREWSVMIKWPQSDV